MPKYGLFLTLNWRLECRETQRIWNDEFSKKFPIDIQRASRRKLRLLNQSILISDLKSPPGNNLESLLGNRKGQYSIRVNQKYRLCFCFSNGNCYDVELVDYH